MRRSVAAVAAVLLIACERGQVEEPAGPVTVQAVHTSLEGAAGLSTAGPAAGKAFVTVHLEEDPAPEKPRDLRGTTLEDAAGRRYPLKSSMTVHGSSQEQTVFGIWKEEVPKTHEHRLLFELPPGATPRKVILPEAIEIESP